MKLLAVSGVFVVAVFATILFCLALVGFVAFLTWNYTLFAEVSPVAIRIGAILGILPAIAAVRFIHEWN